MSYFSKLKITTPTTLTNPSTTSTTTTSAARIKIKDSTTYYPIIDSSTKATFFPDTETEEETTEPLSGTNKRPKLLAAKTEEVSIFYSFWMIYVRAEIIRKTLY